MIKFKGKLSYREVAWQMKWTEKYARPGIACAGTAVAINLLAAICVIARCMDITFLWKTLIWSTMLIPMAVIILLVRFTANRFSNFATEVTIDKEEIHCERGYHFEPYATIPISTVKKQTKTCYYIIYKNFSRSIICQKDLLKEETLEDFEELFKDKINPAKNRNTAHNSL